MILIIIAYTSHFLLVERSLFCVIIVEADVALHCIFPCIVVPVHISRYASIIAIVIYLRENTLPISDIIAVIISITRASINEMYSVDIM